MVKIDENGNKVNVWTESRMEATTLEIPSLRGGHRPTWQSHAILRFPRFARNERCRRGFAQMSQCHRGGGDVIGVIKCDK